MGPWNHKAHLLYTSSSMWIPLAEGLDVNCRTVEQQAAASALSSEEARADTLGASDLAAWRSILRDAKERVKFMCANEEMIWR